MTEVSAVEVATPSTPAIKPNNGETLINLVLDETGSMSSCLEPTISSVNEYLASQKNQPGVCRVSLYTFSSIAMGFQTRSFSINMTAAMNQAKSTGENFRPVFEDQPVADVGELNRDNYRPDGMTNLYDAIGTTIRRVERQLADQDSVPNVLVVIVTDGGENSSREYDLQAIKSMISQKEKEGWTFVYLGANQDAFAVGSSFGLSKGQTMTYSTQAMTSTMSTLSDATRSYRATRGVGGQDNAKAAKGFFDKGEL